MITSFYSFEDAAIHAGVMRSRGHDAVVLDEVTGFLYGPLFSNGFRVWVSDEALADPEVADDDKAPLETSPATEEPSVAAPLVDALRLIAGALMFVGLLFAGFGLAAVVIMFLSELKIVLLEGGDSEVLVSSSLFLIVLLLSVGLIALISPLMGRMTASLRDESSVFGWAARSIVLLWVGAELLWVAAMLVHVLWQMCGGAPLISFP